MSLVNELVQYIHIEGKDDHLKSLAVQALHSIDPQSAPTLTKILCELNNGLVNDNDRQIRGALLDILYPDSLGPGEIGSYLVPPSTSYVGKYDYFLRHELFERSSHSGLSKIASAIAKNNSFILKLSSYHSDTFIGELVSRLVCGSTSVTDPKEVYRWLSLAHDDRLYCRIDQEYRERIITHISSIDNLFNNLFWVAYKKGADKGLSWNKIWYNFTETVLHLRPPESFIAFVTEKFKKAKKSSHKEILFHIICEHIYHGLSPDSRVDLDYIVRLYDSDESLKSIAEEHSFSKVEDWRIRSQNAKLARKEKSDEKWNKNISILLENIEAIRSGEATNILIYCSNIWHGNFSDIPKDLSPVGRLDFFLGEEIKRAILEGFENILKKDTFEKPSQIAELDLSSRIFNSGKILVAAVNQHWEEHHNIGGIPDNNIRSAIAYLMADYSIEDNGWWEHVLINRFQLICDVYECFWMTQLEKKPEKIARFYQFKGDEQHVSIVNELLPKLISKYPTAHTSLLKDMLLNYQNIVTGERNASIIDSIESIDFKNNPEQEVLWYSLAFYFDKNRYFDALNKILSKDDSHKWLSTLFIFHNFFLRDADGKLATELSTRRFVLKLVIGRFKNIPFITDEDEYTFHESDMARTIRKAIHSFGEEEDLEAGKILLEMQTWSEASEWISDLKYAYSNHIRTAREAMFTSPTVYQVNNTLSNGEPANVSDLKALVLDLLCEIATDVKHGNTNGYKAYWRIGKRGVPTNEHVDENTARDRILDALRHKMRHLDMTAEPEVRYANEKRADIAVYCRGMKLPIEIKRDDSRDVWTAAEYQLKIYTKHPNAEGHGIFLVVWFDGNVQCLPPQELNRPKSASDLQQIIQRTIPEASSGLISSFVIDVSKPEEKPKHKPKVEG